MLQSLSKNVHQLILKNVLQLFILVPVEDPELRSTIAGYLSDIADDDIFTESNKRSIQLDKLKLTETYFAFIIETFFKKFNHGVFLPNPYYVDLRYRFKWEFYRITDDIRQDFHIHIWIIFIFWSTPLVDQN